MELEPILLVENNREDVWRVQDAFNHLDPVYRLIVVPDGREAMQYLRGVGLYADRSIFPLPRLVLLELNLPDFHGFEFLQWLRRQPSLHRLPTVVLTESVYSGEVKRAYSLGADSFIIKPMDRETLIKELELSLQYWAPARRKAA